MWRKEEAAQHGVAETAGASGYQEDFVLEYAHDRILIYFVFSP